MNACTFLRTSEVVVSGCKCLGDAAVWPRAAAVKEAD